MEILYEIKETILLNKKELLSMSKEYFYTYLKSIVLDPTGLERRKQLIECFDQYHDSIKLENLYLEIIAENIEYIDTEYVARFIEKLDSMNERTYLYHECILDSFEEEFNTPNKRIKLPYKQFKTLPENTDYYSEVLSMFSNINGINLNRQKNQIEKILTKKTNKV